MIGLGFKVKARKAGSRTLAKEDRGLQPYPNIRQRLMGIIRICISNSGLLYLQCNNAIKFNI